MRFMLIAKATKDSEAGLPPDPRLIAAIGKLSEDMAKAGVLVDAGGLYPSATGARIRLSFGKVTVTDGPFAEARIDRWLRDRGDQVKDRSDRAVRALLEAPRRRDGTELRGRRRDPSAPRPGGLCSRMSAAIFTASPGGGAP
jgi:hypothetical protein